MKSMQTEDSPEQTVLVDKKADENMVEDESTNAAKQQRNDTQMKSMQTEDSPEQTVLVDKKADENMVEDESTNAAKQQRNDTQMKSMQTEDSPLQSKVGDGVAQDSDNENKNQNKSNHNPHWEQYMKERSSLPIPSASRGFYLKQNLIATKNSTRAA